jgi:hypothetical protein
MKARRPPNSTKDIAVTKVQWPAIAMPMDPKTTKITYTYDRRFIADAMAPARCLATNRNPTSGKTHQCPDGVNNVGKHLASPPLGVASTEGKGNWSQRSATCYSAKFPLTGRGLLWFVGPRLCRRVRLWSKGSAARAGWPPRGAF